MSLVLRGAGGMASIYPGGFRRRGSVLLGVAYGKILQHMNAGEIRFNIVINSVLIYANIFGFARKKRS